MALRFALIAACVALASPGSAQDRIQVVTTTTDLRSLTEAVGGELVAAVSLVPPNMDAEDYQPRPQDILRLKNARLMVRVGLDYDLWADRLLAQAGKPELARGGPGYVDASFAISVLELRGMSVGPGTAMPMAAATRIIGSTPRTPRSSPARSSKRSRASTQRMRQATRPTALRFSPTCNQNLPSGKRNSRR